MVVRRKRKVRKMRGSHTHGYGSKKKHRGAGSRGGRGRAGLMKHKKSWMIKHEPEHFGKTGFKVPLKKKIKSIGLRDIDILAKRLNKKEIDLNKFGYQKVLATGRLTQTLKIKAKSFSQKAKDKIQESGSSFTEG